MKKQLNVTLDQLIRIIHRVINSVDKKLLNHGEEVAYIMLNLLKADGSYTDEEILNICTAAIFHDIGAYKVTEKDKLKDVDLISPYNHAIYGSLFIKYFSPLSNLYTIILSHHFTADYYKKKNIEIISKEALLINFADSIDRQYLNQNSDKKNLKLENSDEYLKEHIDLFVEADKKFDYLSKLFNGTYVDELYKFFKTKTLSRKEIIDLSKTLVYAIDFRSEATVIHTILVEAISYQIGKLYGLDENTLTNISVAAVLHDIGKMAIPVEILEKPGSLTNEEFEIMKSHAIIGYNILSGLNLDDIRDMGTLHHEKLDGTGYPFGLKGDEITTEMRIIAIGDIISALLGKRSYKDEFSKEQIIKILNDMVNGNKIDSNITKLFVENYDYIIDKAKSDSRELMDKYLNLNNEYEELLKYYS